MMILARLLFAVGTIFYCFSRIKFTPEGPEFEFRGIATVVGGRATVERVLVIKFPRKGYAFHSSNTTTQNTTKTNLILITFPTCVGSRYSLLSAPKIS